MKTEIGIFQRASLHFVHFGNKIIPAKYEEKKMKKSLEDGTGPQKFLHTVNWIFGQNLQTLISGAKKVNRLAKQE